MGVEPMPRENNTRYAILGMLNQAPMTGYDIRKFTQRSLGYFWPMSYGQIYPTLRSLESEGLVTLELDSHKGGPDRKVYRITDKGMEVLREWVMEPAEKEMLRYEILLKMFFGAAAPTGSHIAKLEDFKHRNEQYLREMQMFEKEIEKILDESPDHRYILSTVRLGKRVYGAQVEWADETLEMLSSFASVTGSKKAPVSKTDRSWQRC